jgi:transcriptional regulator with XRE-family HTH domain
MTKIADILASSQTLGDAVRLLREERRFTLRQLADKVGVSAPFLSDIEHNRRSTDRLAELAKALGADEKDLKRLDGRVSGELKEWMAANPEIGSILEEYRQSGRSVDLLLQSLRDTTEKGRGRR